MLANHIWSYAGWGPRNVSATSCSHFWPTPLIRKPLLVLGLRSSAYDWTKANGWCLSITNLKARGNRQMPDLTRLAWARASMPCVQVVVPTGNDPTVT